MDTYLPYIAKINISDGIYSIINTNETFDYFNMTQGAWSPDGEKILFYLNWQRDSETNDILNVYQFFTIKPDGTDKTELPKTNFTESYASWSPDGSWIVFSSCRDNEGYLDIWRMDSDGSNPSKLVNCQPSCYSSSIAPDGENIAWSNLVAIYVNSKDEEGNSTNMRITETGYSKSGLSWSSHVPPPLLDAYAQPAFIDAGNSATIHWEASEATDVEITGVNGVQPLIGSMEVNPAETTTYTITALGPNGGTETNVTIHVLEPSL